MTNDELNGAAAELVKTIRKAGYEAGYRAGYNTAKRDLSHLLAAMRVDDVPISEEDAIGPQAASPGAVSSPEPDAVTAGGPAPNLSGHIEDTQGPRNTIIAPQPPAPTGSPAASPEPQPAAEGPAPKRARNPREPEPSSDNRLTAQMRGLFNYLCRVADAKRPLPIGHDRLAAAAGVPRGSLSYALRELEQRGWVTMLHGEGHRLAGVRFLTGQVLETERFPDEASAIAARMKEPEPAPPVMEKDGDGLFSTPMKRRCSSCHRIFDTRTVAQTVCPACSGGEARA